MFITLTQPNDCSVPDSNHSTIQKSVITERLVIHHHPLSSCWLAGNSADGLR